MSALLDSSADSRNNFQALMGRDYGFAELLVIGGFLVTMFGELIVKSVATPTSLDVEKKVGKLSTSENHHETRILVADGDAQIHRDALLLILSLCFHSVFEGIAISVADTKANVWKALRIISLYRVFAAITMGLTLLRMLANRRILSCLAYAFAYAISTVVGVAIGIVTDFTTEGAAADWVYAISMGFAIGVFLSIAINHFTSLVNDH